MEVTQSAEHVTHALVGSRETINMGVAETAAFFTMMSSTLYSNQKLAAVREIICNAWDAHIDSNRTDTPLQITLTDDQLIIRDFGYGIPHDMIGPVYGVYGGSTKTQDEKSTGGFGLGSKAPFAYTEHFRVINCHEGTRTVYQMSKSSNEVEGKPSIDTIASMPTTDTGLTVTIDIEPRDKTSFDSLIAGVIANGDILADVNGERAETLPFDSMKHNFLLTTDSPLNDTTPIKLRYGTVVYPLHRSEEIEIAYDQVSSFLNHLNRGSTQYRGGHKRLYLILQAEPNTITVTPSRETLSMQSKTIKTVNSLLSAFNELVVKHIEPACQPIIRDATANLFIKNPHLVSTRPIGIEEALYEYLDKGDNTDTASDPATYVVTVDGAAKKLAARKKLINPKQFKRLWLQRLNCLMPTLDPGMLGPAQALYREVRRVNEYNIVLQHNSSGKQLTSWLRKRLINPLLEAMVTTNLTASRLLVSHSEYASYSRNRYHSSSRTKTERAVKQDLSITYSGSLEFLDPVVVLTHNRRDHEEGLQDYLRYLIHKGKAKEQNVELIRSVINNQKGHLIYLVERNIEAIDEARNFFRSAGIKFLDVTPYQHRQVNERKSSKTTRPVSRKKGFALLSNVIHETDGDFNVLYSQTKEAKRTETPKCFVNFPIKKKDINLNKLPNISAAVSQYIVEHYGDVTALAVTENQYQKCLDMELPPVQVYVAIDLLNQLKTNKALLKYIANKQYVDDLENNLNNSERQAFMLVIDEPYLAKTYRVNTDLSYEDSVFLQWWNYFHNYLPNESQKEYEQLLKPSKAIDKLVSLIEDNPLINCLRWRDVRDELLSSGTTEETKKTLYRLINPILKKGNQNDA